MITLSQRLTVVAALAAALMFGLMSPAIGLAQDATPVADEAPAGIPNHIHDGTCENLGGVVAPLSNLVFNDEGEADMAMAATPMATPMAAIASSVPVAVSVTNIELTLDELLAAPHAFNAHDPSDPSVFIACGNITGAPDEQGNLFVGVAEDNDSNLSGVVWLLDDGTGAGTVVTVFLVGEFESVVEVATGESEAEAEAEADAEDEVLEEADEMGEEDATPDA
jgi:hypothetical protein